MLNLQGILTADHKRAHIYRQNTIWSEIKTRMIFNKFSTTNFTTCITVGVDGQSVYIMNSVDVLRYRYVPNDQIKIGIELNVTTLIATVKVITINILSGSTISIKNFVPIQFMIYFKKQVSQSMTCHTVRVDMSHSQNM